MFDHHRKSPWFAEKYSPSPEMQNLRVRVRKEGWRGRLNAFLHDLEAGKFDPDASEPEPMSPVKDTPINGESVPADTNGTAIPAEESKLGGGGDEEIQFTIDAEEEAGENDGGRPEANGKSSVDTRRVSRGEEVSVMPEGNQVMIRTIPPDIGRVKLEEVSLKHLPTHSPDFCPFNTRQACRKIPGYMYLALGDPLQKRNYYRAGWLRFRDDADMSAVMAELSEKKVYPMRLLLSLAITCGSSDRRFQITCYAQYPSICQQDSLHTGPGQQT
jgi:SERRATE/Ars2, N-terminal domain